MVMPIAHDTNGSMFPPSPFNLTEVNDYCKKLYGVEPRPHWVTTYYGGQVYIYICNICDDDDDDGFFFLIVIYLWLMLLNISNVLL
jgi:hypothetical protein